MINSELKQEITEEDLENEYYGGYVIGYDYSKIQLITEIMAKLKDYNKTNIKALFTYPKTTKNNLEYTYQIRGETLNIIEDNFKKRLLKQLRKERAKALISWLSQKKR